MGVASRHCERAFKRLPSSRLPMLADKTPDAGFGFAKDELVQRRLDCVRFAMHVVVFTCGHGRRDKFSTHKATRATGEATLKQHELE